MATKAEASAERKKQLAALEFKKIYITDLGQKTASTLQQAMSIACKKPDAV